LWRVQVIDFDYYQFIACCAVQRMRARGSRRRCPWAQYIKAHQINEVAPRPLPAEVRKAVL